MFPIYRFLRGFAAFIGAYALMFIAGMFAPTDNALLWIQVLVALLRLAVALYVGWVAWRGVSWVRSGRGLLQFIGLGSIYVGSIGFTAGFFGPMILTPHANQGPMLGIFITGPLGFLFGAMAGGLYWVILLNRACTKTAQVDTDADADAMGTAAPSNNSLDRTLDR